LAVVEASQNEDRDLICRGCVIMVDKNASHDVDPWRVGCHVYFLFSWQFLPVCR
jgi:hypothetical protein